MIQMHLLSVQIRLMMFMRIFMIIIQAGKEKPKEKILTIDTTLPASDPLRFRQNLFDSYKNDNN